jgi:hypothetical protein
VQSKVVSVDMGEKNPCVLAVGPDKLVTEWISCLKGGISEWKVRARWVGFERKIKINQ